MRRELHRQRMCQAWVSLGLTSLFMGACALALSIRFLHREPESGGMMGFWAAVTDEREDSKHPASPALPMVSIEPHEFLYMPAIEEMMLSQDFEFVADMTPPVESDLPELAEADFVSLPTRSSKAQASAAPAVKTPSPAPAPAAGAESDFTPAAYQSVPKPPYPAALRQSRVEGIVRLRIVVDDQGKPQQVEVATSSGHAEFDSTARAWVLKHWRFMPARRAGRAVASTVLTQVRFVFQ